MASLKVLDEQRADTQRSAPVIHECVAWTNALGYEFVEGILGAASATWFQVWSKRWVLLFASNCVGNAVSIELFKGSARISE